MQSCHCSPGWSRSGREALVMQTVWNRSYAWQLYQQETDHDPCLKSFYDSYSRLQEPLKSIILHDYYPATKCLWISYDEFQCVLFKSWIISKMLLKVYQEKRDFINLLFKAFFFDLHQMYLTNTRLDHFNSICWQLKQRELAVYFEGSEEQTRHTSGK